MEGIGESEWEGAEEREEREKKGERWRDREKSSKIEATRM